LLIPIVIGGVLIYIGAQEAHLAAHAKEQPQQISLADLAAKGPGDNAHIILTDYLLCEFAFVYEEKDGRWQKVWIPAVPLDGEYHQKLKAMLDPDGKLKGEPPMPDDIRVIVKLPNARNNDDIGKVAEADTLQGVVVNSIESLGSKEKKILQDSYPRVDFGTCLIVEEGRRPASFAKRAGLLGGGIVLALVGIGWLLLSLRKSA